MTNQTHTEDGKQLYFVKDLKGNLINETPVTKEHLSREEYTSVIGEAILFVGIHVGNFEAVTE